MPDDSGIRMYSRSRSGDKRSRSSRSAPGSPTPSTPKSPSTSPLLEIAGANPRPANQSETQKIVEKYHQEMGVSTYALRAMFRSTKFSALKRLDKHITSAQHTRISRYSRDSRKGFEKRLNLAHPASIDESLLEFALTVRPIDTLIEFVDLNQDDTDIRAIRNLITDQDVLELSDLPNDSRLADIVSSYQSLLQSEVDLLSGANHDDKGKQVHAIAQRARECFEKVRAMIQANKMREFASARSAAEENLQSPSTPRQEEPAGSQKITKETMEKYKQEHGTF